MSNILFPPLDTPRLHLRTLHVDDVEFIYRHFANPEVNQFLLDEAPIHSLEQAQAIVDFFVHPTDDTYTRWVLIDKINGKPIGTCGFHKWNRRNHRAEIGYDLTPSAWGQGYMREALTAMLKHGFTRMELNRVEALVYPENTASLKLLKKFNFQPEGLLRDYFYQDGQYYDHWLLSLLRAEVEL
ncbi:MAG: GNAT family N-acetyltransferase [Thainema sp.]